MHSLHRLAPFLLALPLLFGGCSEAAYDRSRTDIAGLPQPGIDAAAPQTSDQENVQQSIKNLLEGTMRYQVPDSMTIGESEVVNLRVSSTPHDGRLALGIPGVSESVKFADSIRATLYGGDDFTITPRQANDPQLIPPAGSVLWSWDVKPLHSGLARLLTLRLDTYVNVNGRDVFYGTTKETKVNVVVSPASAALDFTTKHLEWLWGLLAVPAAAFARRRFVQPRRKRQVPTVTGDVRLRKRSRSLK